LLNDAKAPNNKLVDFEPPDAGATDRQPTNSESANGQRANRDGGKYQRPDSTRSDRLCPDTDRWAMGEPSVGAGSIAAGDACTAFTPKHQVALHRWFDCRTTQRGLTRRS